MKKKTKTKNNDEKIDNIISLLTEAGGPLKLLDISKTFKIKSNTKEYEELREVLNTLQQQGLINKNSRRRYSIATDETNRKKKKKSKKIEKEYNQIVKEHTQITKNYTQLEKEYNQVVKEYNLPDAFPTAVIKEAKDFTDQYQFKYLDTTFDAKKIIDGYQISQCFLLKIKEWCNEKTRLGFVSNSSNFYSEAVKFQNFFYSNYGIEKIYELSKVKDILFEKAEESVVAVIFDNQYSNNTIEYYSVEMGLFSEKPFELLIIQEDKSVPIKQEKLTTRKVKLRDYLVGNEFDRNLADKLNSYDKLSFFISD